MTKPANTGKMVQVIASLGLLAGFFMPWVQWKETNVPGYYLPSGKFFSISADQFGLANPFPSLDFTFYLFWLIPVLALLTLILVLQKKKTNWSSLLAGSLALALLTVFFLFSRTLGDLGVGEGTLNMLRLPFGLVLVSAILLILTATPPVNWLKKAAWVLAGPLFAFAAYLVVEKTVWNEKFGETKDIRADYRLTAADLLREFEANDSLANARYREKIVEVTGNVSAVEQSPDSTVTIRFTDTTGSYIIFSFDREQFGSAKDVKQGDQVTVKGSCSGSIYSAILSTTSISFKRSIINKK